MTDNFENVAVDGPVVNEGELGSSTFSPGHAPEEWRALCPAVGRIPALYVGGAKSDIQRARRGVRRIDTWPYVA